MATLGVQVLATVRALRDGRWRTRSGKVRIASQVLSAVGLWVLHRNSQDSDRVLEDALADGLGPDYRQQAVMAAVSPLDGPIIRAFKPLPTYIARRSRMRASGVSYGPHGKRNRLDIWASEDLKPGAKAPVLIQVPGGAWVTGDTKNQAYPLMDRLRTAGWVCVPISYRLSPRATWPDHIVDVKRAIAWVKEHISEYGGDPDFIVITGGSAGGHLSSLAALTANQPVFQPGFEEADTSVRAAVPFYGAYNLSDWDGKGGPARTISFFERVMFKVSMQDEPELWRQASPVNWVHAEAPPMMLIHGTNDSLVPVGVARRMTDELRRTSRQAVVYAELPYAQHAFDIYASLRTRYTVRAVERFLAWVRAEYLLSAAAAAESPESPESTESPESAGSTESAGVAS
jgi:acetyl esterase/lipase